MVATATETAAVDVRTAEFRVMDFAVGQRFESKDALETRLKTLAVARGIDYDVDRSRPDFLTCNCWVKGCSWSLRASPNGDSREFYIRIYVAHHSCSITERFARCRQATPDVLGKIYKEYIGRIGPGVMPAEVGQALSNKYGIKMDYWKAHHTLRKARELVRGTSEDGYKALPAYLYRIRRANPGTYSRLVVDAEDRFKYVFVALGGSLHGLPYMRKVIVVDGTFLQGKYRGTLLIASAQDGNYQIFPVAFSIVDSENDASWQWFFTELKSVIPDDKELAIISDRHRSIGKAIANVYPLAARGICTYHLHKNIMVKFKGSGCYGLVKKAANAFRIAEFDEVFEQIRRKNPRLHDYLIKADIRLWSRAYFKGDMYNVTTSNIAESMNKVLKGARGYPVDKLLDEIRSTLTRWFAYRRRDAQHTETLLTRGAEELLGIRVSQANNLQVQEIDESRFEVTNGTTTDVVNLRDRTCSCREFDLEKIPCCHAEKKNISRIGLCHRSHLTEYLCNAYAKPIMPKDVAAPLPEVVAAQLCLPPIVRQQPGRPKKSRIKPAIEVALAKRRPRKRHTCSCCRETWHNRTTCPQEA